MGFDDYDDMQNVVLDVDDAKVMVVFNVWDALVVHYILLFLNRVANFIDMLICPLSFYNMHAIVTETLHFVKKKCREY